MDMQATSGAASARVGVVAIGRNEGERLARCLRSVAGHPCVYVDSGSVDDSPGVARSLGVDIVQLAIPPNFTAARARNEGLARLLALHPDLRFVQMVDGDCEVRDGWIATALSALERDARCAAVLGRRRERHPDRSVYNALCDDEWDIPLGEAAGCGGDALFRVAALDAVGGYDEAMIAGEDSEMSMRMRKAGWHLTRIDAEMTLHDAAMLRLGQWWRRARRAGHGFAEMAWRHPDARWPDWPRSVRSLVVWGAALPAVLALCLVPAILHRPAWAVGALPILGAYAAKAAQIAWRARRAGMAPKVALAKGVLLMLAKPAGFGGVVRFHLNRLKGRRSTIIEYKGAAA